MIPCPYCGGTPTLGEYRSELGRIQYLAYRVTCTSCGASTWDGYTRNSTKLAWDRKEVMRMTTLECPDIGEVDG